MKICVSYTAHFEGHHSYRAQLDMKVHILCICKVNTLHNFLCNWLGNYNFWGRRKKGEKQHFPYVLILNSNSNSTVLILKLDSRFISIHCIAYNFLYLTNDRLLEIILGYILGFRIEESGDIKSTIFHTRGIFLFCLILSSLKITVLFVLFCFCFGYLRKKYTS